MKVIFRVDANEEIATGHMMRCITIAKELSKRMIPVAFLTADEKSHYLLEDTMFTVKCLHSDWQDMESELPAMAEFLKEYAEADAWLIVDSYSATPHYLAELSRYARVAYFDDLFASIYEVDAIINYNLYYDRFSYENSYDAGKTKLLLGGAYVPLREQFQITPTGHAESETLNNLLLICGGGDKYKILPDIIRSIRTSDHESLQDVMIHVVLGGYSEEYDTIVDLKQQYGNVTIYQRVENMAELMCRCDFAVSAASTVLYELCALQIPTVFFCMADNQEYDREAFGKEIMCYAGDIRNERSEVLSTINDKLDILITNAALRGQMKKRMVEVVDGFGARRIVDALLS